MSNFLDERKTVDSPVKTRIEWKSELGSFCYQKETEKDGKKEYQTIELGDITFIPVQWAVRIGGFSDSQQSGIYSNTITELSKHKLKVKYSKTKSPIAEGIYSDIKADIKAVGGKYQNIFYSVLTYANGKQLVEPRFVEIVISGSASVGLSNSDEKPFYLVGKQVAQYGYTEEKKGATKYKAPIFKTVPIDKSEAPDFVVDFARKVKDYFVEYLELTQGVQPVQKATEPPQPPQNFDDWDAGLKEPIGLDLNPEGSELPF